MRARQRQICIAVLTSSLSLINMVHVIGSMGSPVADPRNLSTRDVKGERERESGYWTEDVRGSNEEGGKRVLVGVLKGVLIYLESVL